MNLRWIDEYVNSGAFNASIPTFFECHIGGIGVFLKDTSWPGIVTDAPVGDGIYPHDGTMPSFPLVRPWDINNGWVGVYDDIMYWAALEIFWGMRGFALQYLGGDNNSIKGYFNNASVNNKFTKLPQISDGWRLKDLSGFLSGNNKCVELTHFDMSNVTSLSGAFLNSIVSIFPSTKYDASSVTSMASLFQGCDFNGTTLTQSSFPFLNNSNVVNYTNAFRWANVQYFTPNLSSALVIDNLYRDRPLSTSSFILDLNNIIRLDQHSTLQSAKECYYSTSAGSSLNHNIDFRWDLLAPGCSAGLIFPWSINANNFILFNKWWDSVSGVASSRPFKITLQADSNVYEWSSDRIPVVYNAPNIPFIIDGTNRLKSITTPFSESQLGPISPLDTSSCQVINKLYNTIVADPSKSALSLDLSSCTDCSQIFDSLKILDLSNNELVGYHYPSSSFPGNQVHKLINTDHIVHADQAFRLTKFAQIEHPFNHNGDVSMYRTYGWNSHLTKLICNNVDSPGTIKFYRNAKQTFYDCNQLSLIVDGSNNPLTIVIKADGAGGQSFLDCEEMFRACSQLTSIHLKYENIIPWNSVYVDRYGNAGKRSLIMTNQFQGCSNLVSITGGYQSSTWFRAEIGMTFPTDRFNGCTNLLNIEFKEVCCNMDFRDCRYLTQQTILSLFSACVNRAGDSYDPCTLTFNAYLGPEQANVITNSLISQFALKKFNIEFINI